MQFAPYLLQAFAARMLATESRATIARSELSKLGYDVDTLVEMIGAYNELPESSRGFVVVATETTVSIERKANAVPPAAPAPAGPPRRVVAPEKSVTASPPTLMRALGLAAPKVGHASATSRSASPLPRVK